jgi:hypothetical protein
MEINFVLEDNNKKITAIAVAAAIIDSGVLDVSELDELALYLEIYAKKRNKNKDGEACPKKYVDYYNGKRGK